MDVAVGAGSRSGIRRAGDRWELGGQDRVSGEQVPDTAAQRDVFRLAGLDPGGQPGPVLRRRAADHLEFQSTRGQQSGSAEGTRGYSPEAGSGSLAVDY